MIAVARRVECSLCAVLAISAALSYPIFWLSAVTSIRQFCTYSLIFPSSTSIPTTQWSTKLRDALAATDIPGDQTIMPWKRLKFDAESQNETADPVLIQYLGGKFVTVFPSEVAVAAAKWPMNG